MSRPARVSDSVLPRRSPFPPEYEGYHELWFCEFTLRFFRTEKGWLRHHVRDCSISPVTPAADCWLSATILVRGCTCIRSQLHAHART